MQHRIVGQRVAVPEPHLLLGCLGGQQLELVTRHDPDVPFGELLESGVVEHTALGDEVGQVVGRHREGRGVLVFDAALVGLERRRHREDGLAVLDRVDASGDERAAVAEPFDDEDGGRLGVAGPQEVAVQ